MVSGFFNYINCNGDKIDDRNVFSIPTIGLYLVLVNGPLWWDWSIGTTLLVFLALMILALGLMRVLKFWGIPKF